MTKQNPERLSAVLDIVSQERLHLERTIRAKNQALAEMNTKASEALRPLMVATAEAAAELSAHERYRHQSPEAEWAEERRPLVEAHNKATEAERAERQKAAASLQPLHDELTELLRKREELRLEWGAHARRARRAGITDLREFWVPEHGLPPEE